MKMTQEDYVKQQARRSKKGSYTSVRPRIKAAIGWMLGEMDVENLKGLKVIDLGTRDGWTLDLYRRLRSRHTTGVELVPDTARWANKVRKGSTVVEGDMHNLQGIIPDDSYHLVTSLHSFEHCHNTGAALSEMFRICKPGGYVFIVVPEEEHDPHHAEEKRRRTHNQFFRTISQFTACVCGESLVDESFFKHTAAKYKNAGERVTTEYRLLTKCKR